jgi:carbonic anhydrase/acetyltransferase-like protein (isoleucine patch superfamily)
MEVLRCDFRGLPSCGKFVGSHYEVAIGGDDGNMITVGNFSVIMDAQVVHEDDRQVLEQIIEAP